MSDGLPIQPIGITTAGAVPERTYTQSELNAALEKRTREAAEIARKGLKLWVPLAEQIAHDILSFIKFDESNALAERDRRVRELEATLAGLLDKLDAVAKATEGMFTLAHVHGMGYQGPNWSEEYKAGRAALRAGEEKQS